MNFESFLGNTPKVPVNPQNMEGNLSSSEGVESFEEFNLTKMKVGEVLIVTTGSTVYRFECVQGNSDVKEDSVRFLVNTKKKGEDLFSVSRGTLSSPNLIFNVGTQQNFLVQPDIRETTIEEIKASRTESIELQRTGVPL